MSITPTFPPHTYATSLRTKGASQMLATDLFGFKASTWLVVSDCGSEDWKVAWSDQTHLAQAIPPSFFATFNTKMKISGKFSIAFLLTEKCNVVQKHFHPWLQRGKCWEESEETSLLHRQSDQGTFTSIQPLLVN